MVACHDVVNVVDSSWTHTDLAEVSGPHTSVGILCLILTEVGGVDVVVDVAVTFIPLLVIVLLVVLMGGMHSEVLGNPS